MTQTIKRLGGNGPDILLIHGYGSDRLSWIATAPALFGYASVWVIDLPGHGKATRECGDGSMPVLVELVREAIGTAGLDHLHLLGHSLGGRIAMELACLQPQQVQSLALLAPAGMGKAINRDFLTRFYQANDADSTTTLLRTLVHDPRMITRSLSSALLANLEQAGTRQALECIAQGLIAAGQDAAGTVEKLHQLQLPSLSIWGKQDQIEPPDISRIQSFPGAVHQLDACGHLPHIEQRITVNSLLESFYRKEFAAA